MFWGMEASNVRPTGEKVNSQHVTCFLLFSPQAAFWFCLFSFSLDCKNCWTGWSTGVNTGWWWMMNWEQNERANLFEWQIGLTVFLLLFYHYMATLADSAARRVPVLHRVLLLSVAACQTPVASADDLTGKQETRGPSPQPSLVGTTRTSTENWAHVTVF